MIRPTVEELLAKMHNSRVTLYMGNQSDLTTIFFFKNQEILNRKGNVFPDSFFFCICIFTSYAHFLREN